VVAQFLDLPPGPFEAPRDVSTALGYGGRRREMFEEVEAGLPLIIYAASGPLPAADGANPRLQLYGA
jgi:hypothetical protein